MPDEQPKIYGDGGNVGPVLDTETLLRRIHPNHIDNGKPLALAFRDRTRQLSVDREAFRSVAILRAAYPTHAFCRLLAGKCRSAGYDAIADPIRENPAHALVLVPPTSDPKEASYDLLALAEFLG